MDKTLHSCSSETSAVVAKYTVNLVYCTGLEINLLILRSDLQFLLSEAQEVLDVIGLTAWQSISLTHLQT